MHSGHGKERGNGCDQCLLILDAGAFAATVHGPEGNTDVNGFDAKARGAGRADRAAAGLV